MGEIKHMKIGKNWSISDLGKLFEPEEFPDYARSDGKYFQYTRLLSLIDELEDLGKWEAKGDDPELKLDQHNVTIKMIDGYFDPTETNILSDVFKLADSVMFFGDKFGNISLVVGVDGVYKANEDGE